jgi:hypothetical protein
VHEWIKSQEAHETAAPLRINRKDVFLPTTEPSITSEPLNEQDVIGLFNQFLAGGVIRGVRLMSTSQHQQYDGVFRYVLKEPLAHHIFDKEKNPLGIEQGQASKPFVSAPMILEYKFSLDGLIQDFEKGEKNEKEIKLAVVWETGEDWKARYTMTPLLYLPNVHHRYVHGVTHIARNVLTGEATFQVIALKELIAYINDPDAVQQYQNERYIEAK